MFHWEFTAFAIPLFASAIVLALTALICWRRRATPGAISLMGVCLCAMIYSFGYAFEIGMTTVDDVQSWLKIQYFNTFLTGANLIFVANYTSAKQRFTPIVSMAIFIPAIITLLFALTNEHHHLIWLITDLDRSAGFTLTVFRAGGWYYVNVLYAHVLVVLASLLLFYTYPKTRGLYRRQTLMLIIGSVIPFVASIVYQSKLILPGFDLVPYFLTVSSLVYAWAILEYHLVDVMPVARELILQSMTEGVIVLDANNRLIFLNRAAQRYMGVNPATAVGRPISEVLFSWGDALGGVFHRFFPNVSASDELKVMIVDGEVGVVSEVGKGSLFYFTLPINSKH